jgi:hypothetical protein
VRDHGTYHHRITSMKELFRYVMTQGPHACTWPAWRSVGSRSGHTVGCMCIQPAGAAIQLPLVGRHAGGQRAYGSPVISMHDPQE